MTVVIPHYGEKSLLDRCLASLDAAGVERDNVIVVDSNPPNPRRFFTAAVNHGIRIALKREAGLIGLVNNDVEVRSGWYEEALRCWAEEDRQTCGIVASRCLQMNRPDFIWCGGSEQCYPTGLHKSGFVSKGDLNERTEEEWASFAAVFLNTWMLREIGLLDKRFRHICSDADYCLRVRECGWKVYYEPKSVVVHAVGSSFSGSDAACYKVMCKDIQRFESKWVHTGRLAKLTRYNGPEYLGETRNGVWQRPGFSPNKP